MSDIQRAKALKAIGRHGEAAGLLGAVLASEPENADALLELAVCLHNTDELTGALDAIESALRVTPSRAGAWRVRALIVYDLGRRDAAVESAREARRLAPDDWRVHVVLARVETDRALAYEAASRAVELAPDKPLPHVITAEAAARSGRLPAAENAYLVALALAPNDASTHRGLAAVRLRRRRPLLALQSMVAALRADPARGIRQETIAQTALTILRRARWVSVVCVILGLYAMAIAADEADGYLDPMSLGPRGLVLVLVLASTFWSLGWPLSRLPTPMRSGLVRLALHHRAVARRTALVVALTSLAVVVTLLPL